MGKDQSSNRVKHPNELSQAAGTPPTANQSAYLSIVPQLFWFLLAVVAFSVLTGPVLRLLDEGRISKFAVGILKLT
jgi:hypothetical protein